MITCHSERRERLRFAVTVPLEYLLPGARRKGAGTGRLVNISSGGVLFHSDAELSPGRKIELSIPWPAKLNGQITLSLRATGVTVRCRGCLTAVRLLKHEFHIRARARAIKFASLAATA